MDLKNRVSALQSALDRRKDSEDFLKQSLNRFGDLDTLDSAQPVKIKSSRKFNSSRQANSNRNTTIVI